MKHLPEVFIHLMKNNETTFSKNFITPIVKHSRLLKNIKTAGNIAKHKKNSIEFVHFLQKHHNGYGLLLENGKPNIAVLNKIEESPERAFIIAHFINYFELPVDVFVFSDYEIKNISYRINYFKRINISKNKNLKTWRKFCENTQSITNGQ